MLTPQKSTKGKKLTTFLPAKCEDGDLCSDDKLTVMLITAAKCYRLHTPTPTELLLLQRVQTFPPLLQMHHIPDLLLEIYSPSLY